jgi:hypothetical protein
VGLAGRAAGLQNGRSRGGRRGRCRGRGEEDEPGGAEADVACRAAYDGVGLGKREVVMSICRGKGAGR